VAAVLHQLIGQQVAVWRRLWEMSQRELAAQAGVNRQHLSQIEAGERVWSRRSTLVGVAGGLRVSVEDLVGQPGDPTDPAKSDAVLSVPKIRVAAILRAAGEITPAGGADVDRAVDALAAGDLAGAGPMLPGLIGSCSGPDLVRAGLVTMWHLHYGGYGDLSRAVAYLALDAAREVDTPVWLGVGEYVRASSLPPEVAGLAARLAGDAARDLQKSVGDPQVRQVYGMLHLTAALRAAVAGDSTAAESHLAEARSEADSLGEPADGRGLCGLGFGPTNVGIWRVAVTLELGDKDAAIAAAESVDPRRTPVPTRQAAYWIELGRALAAVGRDEDAVAALMRAEEICPQWVRMRPTVRDTVRVALYRIRRRALSAAPLRRAARMVEFDV
jgi:transcriptional regulator with XRE-family HTH domain